MLDTLAIDENNIGRAATRITMDMDCDEKKPIINDGIIYFDHFNGLLWELCPLDKSHYCRKARMKDHIQECKQQCLKGPRKVECPFNALHIVNLMEIADHIMTCENRVVRTNDLCDLEPKRETVEGIAMEPLNVALRVPDTWGQDDNPEFGYDPMEGTKFRAVLRPPPPGLSKAKKKEWRAKERQRWRWLTGETREKPRGVPYPTPNQIQNAKAASREMSAVKDESDIMGIIDKLGNANIADPRDSVMKRINARLKVLQVMEAKLKEEKLELQRQVEQYLASIGKTEEGTVTSVRNDEAEDERRTRNVDPRRARRNNDNDTRRSSSSNPDYTQRIVPDLMTSAAMVR